MDKILLRNISVYGFHGVNEHERIYGQRFIIDVELYTDLKKACVTDNVEDTIDYSIVNNKIIEIARSRKFALIEALASEIMKGLFVEFNNLAKIKIRIKKPEAPLIGDFKWVGIEIERERED